MSPENLTPDERVAEKLRDAFPSDAGLSAEKTRAMYGRLGPVASARAPRFGRVGALRLATAVSVVVLLSAATLFATNRLAPHQASPQGAIAQKVEQTASAVLPVPQMALAALDGRTDVVHYTSVGDTDFGPQSGHSTEEMWFDQDARIGRLVTRYYTGRSVTETRTIVAGNSSAVIIVEKAGQDPVSSSADPNGTWRREFEKLATYRQMLASGEVTVTGRGRVDGVRTIKLSGDIPDFPAKGINVEMKVEIRANDYLPVSFSSTFRRVKDGAVLGSSSRTFTLFEHVPRASLPDDLFRPLVIDLPSKP